MRSFFKLKYLICFKFIIVFLFLLAFTPCQAIQKNNSNDKGHYNVPEKDILAKKILRIDGYWSFYWKQLPFDEDKIYNPINLQQEEFISIHHDSWLNYDHPAKGYGTFRLRIKSTELSSNLTLRIGRIYSACEIWINGEKKQEYGQFSKIEAQSIANATPLYIELPNEPYIDLMIVVSNYHHRSGGIFLFGVEIADKEVLNEKQSNATLIEFSSSFTLIIIVFIHILAFFFVERKSLFIYFAFTCLFMAIRQLFVGEVIITKLFPEITYGTIQVWRYLPMHIGASFFILYFNELLAKDKLIWVTNIIIIMYGISSIYTLISPVYESTYAAIIHLPTSGAVLIYTTYLVTISLIKKRPLSKFIFINSLFLLAILTNDLLLSSLIITKSIFLLSYAGITFFILQVLVNYLYIKKATVESNSLNTELKTLTKNYDEKTEEAKSLLVETNQLLKVKSELTKQINRIYKETRHMPLLEILAELKSDQKENERTLFIRENFSALNYELIQNLKTQYINLTKTDIEICSLIILGLTSKEIANMRNTSYEAIKKSRYRIRKKLNISKDLDLKYFLRGHE